MKMTEKTVFVFKTDIQNAEQASRLTMLYDIRGVTDWSTDLEDSDNILRIIGYDLDAEKIVKTVEKLGFDCKELARGQLTPSF